MDCWWIPIMERYEGFSGTIAYFPFSFFFLIFNFLYKRKTFIAGKTN